MLLHLCYPGSQSVVSNYAHGETLPFYPNLKRHAANTVSSPLDPLSNKNHGCNIPDAPLPCSVNSGKQRSKQNAPVAMARRCPHWSCLCSTSNVFRGLQQASVTDIVDSPKPNVCHLPITDVIGMCIVHQVGDQRPIVWRVHVD